MIVSRLSDFPVHEKLEKFMEDVKYGIYPLTAFNIYQPTPTKPRNRIVLPAVPYLFWSLEQQMYYLLLTCNI
jgi:hypothetical protein